MLIKKYFYAELVANAVKILIVLIFILPITELFKLLEQNINNNISLASLFAAMLYGTIASFPQILTISCFLTVIITINRYCRERELIVLLASGVSLFFWLRLVMIFIAPFAIFCAISTMYITPWATLKSHQYSEFIAKKQTGMFLSPGIFKENDNGKEVLYLDHYSLSLGVAYDIFIQYLDKNANVYNITAKSGKLSYNNDISNLTLNNGECYQIISNNHLDSSSNNIAKSNNQNNGINNNTMSDDLNLTKMNIGFEEFKINIENQEVNIINGNSNIATSSINNLLKLMAVKNNNNAKAELSWRLSTALMTIVITVLAIPFSIQLGRVQNNLVFIMPLLIYALYNNLILTANGYLNQGQIHSIYSIQSIHLILFLLAILLMYYKNKPKGYFIIQLKNKLKFKTPIIP